MLQISGLNTYYGESHILRDVDLTVPAGQMVCLIGRNGVGKTTLMKSIMGLLTPRSGSIALEGESLSGKSPDRRAKLGIGYVPQGREIVPRLTVKENLLLGLEARSPHRASYNGSSNGSGNGSSSRSKIQSDEIPDDIFELFPALKSLLGRQGGNLSGGQQQQLAIARALMGNPRLLLMDEPTEGIQPSIVLEIEAAVRQIVETKGVSVLLVEQHLHFVRQANWYYAMQKGGIVASGQTGELSQEAIQQFLAV